VVIPFEEWLFMVTLFVMAAFVFAVAMWTFTRMAIERSILLEGSALSRVAAIISFGLLLFIPVAFGVLRMWLRKDRGW
jgi:hypothetical protein